ncbi:P-loop NTPase fold protein [Chelatococcus reniformis]|uniref:KAP NTPase domain-containing protein n=1 Tax=Chelatococcus reniformis TaxID=1494448 RepID=A0A916UYU9_9HYPH|nr:P-loop NTPase fold protein [Chelatococcus reniformis]GGC94720.1 hypothetical protein GCM10010994_60580 [Chelatococcus reniformis]
MHAKETHQTPKSHKLIIDEVARFLASDAAEALCISGDWGVGKTHAWNQAIKLCIENGSIREKRYSYVSAFGLNSLDALKLAVVENINFLVASSDSDEAQAAAKAGNFAISTIAKGRGFLHAIPVAGKILSESGSILFSTIRDQIVCVDDLERRGSGLSIENVLGLVSFLKEERNCKIVMLLNEEHLGDETRQFRINFEKAFDIHLRFKPSAKDSAEIAIRGQDDIGCTLRSHCETLNLSNIRVIKKIEHFARLIEPILYNLPNEILKQALHTITLYCWIKYQPTEAPSREFILEKRASHFFDLSDILNKSSDSAPDETNDKWHGILDAYGFAQVDAFDELIIASIDDGFFNQLLVRDGAERHAVEIKGSIDLGHFKSAWRRYKSSFDEDEELLVEEMKSAVQRTPSLSADDLQSAVRLFKSLGREVEALELIAVFISNNSEKGENFWDTDEVFFFSRIVDPHIAEAFANKKAEVAKELKLVDVLLRIGRTRSCGSTDEVFLSTQSSENFHDVFLSESGERLRDVIRGALFFQRVVNAGPEQRKICEVAEDALRSIGSTSNLNRHRAASWLGHPNSTL